MNSALIQALMMMSNPAGGPSPGQQRQNPMVDAIQGWDARGGPAAPWQGFRRDPFGPGTAPNFDPLRRPGQPAPAEQPDPFGLNRTDR